MSIAEGPLFVCLVVPLPFVVPGGPGLTHERLRPAIVDLESARCGGYHLRPSRNTRYSQLVCASCQRDPNTASHAYAHLTRHGQIELVTTASSFVHTADGHAVIFDTAGYEGALENDGLPAVRPALKRLDLTGPALVSLSLLRLDGVEAGIRHPGTGVIHSEPVPAPAATAFIQLDQIDGLSRTALRGPFDRLRQKLGLELGPASVEVGRS